MGWDPKAGHIDTHDPHAIYFIGQQAQRHAAGGRHAKICDNDCIVKIGVGQFMNRIADILKQLARNQGFRIKRHIANRTSRPIEMANKGQAIDAASRTREHSGHAAHPQANAQGAKSRAHGLRFIMRTLGIILGELREQFRIPRQFSRLFHFRSRMTSKTISWHNKGFSHLIARMTLDHFNP